ncbi:MULTISPECIES: hypothetical protein [unclassified Clostridium]|uniref:hypothetical protein n=1 Tax=unclassified Clostridium TaxID=2614128 RepID=UPI000297E355|nr:MULTISPECIES: hypothetical protein [unclassified Clostridium]EKQ50725.1 MAG: hypothetical protein A370_05444 [Clostridium sp. Maddingley MBC34-26]
MNKEFIKKMLKAKRFEYEAIKEIIPDKIRDRIDCFEKEAISIIRDIGFEMIKEDIKDKEEKNNADNKSTKKINIDFN